MKKPNLVRKISIIVPIICAFFINSAVLLADSGNPIQNSLTPPVIQQETTQSQQIADQRALKRMQFLRNIRDEIRSTQKDFVNVTRNVSDANQRLMEVQQKVTTLSEQLDNLDSQISRTESLIFNVTMQIGEKENQLVLLYEEMEVKKAALQNQKKMLVEYLETIYEQESSVSDTTNGNEEINIAKLLLSDESVGDQLQQLKYFNILENAGHEIFNRLDALLQELKSDELSIQEKKDKLARLNAQLTEEKQNLEIQRTAKANLLEETKGEEVIYGQLLEESRQQQQQVHEDLDTLRQNLKFIQEKILELGDDFNPDEYAGLLGPGTASVYEYMKSGKKGEDPVFHWPVSPSRGISAYFHDVAYKAAFGFTHNAVDVRVPQGSIVRAPADGVVYKVRDNGYGYSYLIIAHKGGYMTVYGHVSDFKVEEGEKVFTGQQIALSGGTPGTQGAGLMTTGAHLHFELLKGGNYVDPLDFLPLTYLPFDTLPDKYQTRVTGNKPKVRRVSVESETALQEGSLTQMIERNAVFEEMTRKALQDQSGAP